MNTFCAHTWISQASNKLFAHHENTNKQIPQITSKKESNTHSHPGVNIFSPSGINNYEEAYREATIIFCYCLHIDKIQLLLKKDFIATAIQQAQLQNYLTRRMRGEPLAYIFGQKEFFGIDFIVNEYTLIPRPETELLVEEALKYDDEKPLNILDLGCGSGCIALSILKNRRTWRAFLVDISNETLKTSHQNAVNLELENRAYFILGDFSCKNFCENLWESFKDAFEHKVATNIENKMGSKIKDKIKNGTDANQGSFANSTESKINATQFDIIISNPPYIPMEEYPQLHVSVKDHEPKIALVSSDSNNFSKNEHVKNLENNLSNLRGKGLFHAQAVIHLAEKMLKPNGLLLIEHGYNQAQDCRDLCDPKKWHSVSSGNDYSHMERYLKAFRKEE